MMAGTILAETPPRATKTVAAPGCPAPKTATLFSCPLPKG